ncbi:heavy-metal-associated domain-containing protein [Desulfurivibrio sp. D14AmB]|uniref:heavy-metal-associated domain-containing protein n=1 Tax=Desulfurivibrio sp. D14AmB TaxID=3374370 RepID=UPI00376EE716
MSTIRIKGMTCAHCVASVTKALSDISGISNVHVSLSEGVASFESNREVPLETIREAIHKIGFEVE